MRNTFLETNRPWGSVSRLAEDWLTGRREHEFGREMSSLQLQEYNTSRGVTKHIVKLFLSGTLTQSLQ
jgi:hypothetical protein